MSTENSLTFNYDKDSFEDGTFEDISEFSLEEEEEDEESDVDDNYSMQVEMTKIIMPKYSANNKKNLKTLIEEEQRGNEESDTEQEDDQIENDKIEIEEISRTSDEEELDNSDTDLEHDGKQPTNEVNNEDEEDENNSESENCDSDDMDIEMKQYSSHISDHITENEKEFDKKKNKSENSDIEDDSDTDKEDSEMDLKVHDSVEKMGDDSSEELSLDEGKSDNEDDETNAPSVELVVSSKRPSSFNSDDHAYHLDFVKKSQTSIKSNGQNKSKNLNKNLTFSNDRLRDIERQNKILLQRILTKKPTYENLTAKTSNRNLQARKVTSAAINRKKQQHQIDIDNQILKRKLEAIALRRRAKQ